jgi:ribosomal 50S subunit-recycling heat shock protein
VSAPVGEHGLRVDVLLHRLCITRSRSEAKNACDSGAVSVQGRPVKASEAVSVGDRVAIRFPRRLVEFELQAIPPKSTSKKSAKEMYHVLRDEPVSVLQP